MSEDFTWILNLLPLLFFVFFWVGVVILVGKLSGWNRLVKEMPSGNSLPPLGGDEKPYKPLYLLKGSKIHNNIKHV